MAARQPMRPLGKKPLKMIPKRPLKKYVTLDVIENAMYWPMRVRVMLPRVGSLPFSVFLPASNVKPPVASRMIVMMPAVVFAPAPSPRSVSSSTIPTRLAPLNVTRLRARPDV